tara:strand:+ start:45 stop:2339 length:2295 start_codon:yes stop_codon:yes gene_type:complete
MAINYNGPDFGFGNTEKSTINKKNDIYVTTINDPNSLHQFASYTSLFTLSALSQADLENTTTLLNSKPHDIIIRSAGIGPDNNATADGPRVSDLVKDFTVDKGERVVGAIGKSRDTLARNRDLYIRSVNMNSLPGLNEKRRLTSVTQISMEIVEPAGITLIERIRAAAVNNGYLDHLDAPFMLTIDFKGFDEQGNVASTIDSQNMKRVIPVKLVDMQMDVNQAGTVYVVKMIPYNEFAYVNRYNYPRTTGTLSPQGRLLSDVFKSLEELLNKQNEDEKDTGLVEKNDIYSITFAGNKSSGGGADMGRGFIEDVIIQIDNLEQTGMQAQKTIGVDKFDNKVNQPLDYMKINPNNAITKILEEIMKGHPAYSDKKFDEWKSKVTKTLNVAQFKGGAQGVLEEAQDFYFDYFKIRSSVVPIEADYDTIRARNRKKINFHVEPYKVHAYSLAIPGVSTGQNFKNFVFKTYNYIFTGENVDVMDLDINYRVAYFQSRLKDFEATNLRKNTVEDASDKATGGTSATDHNTDGNLQTSSEVSIVKSEGTGKTGGTPSQLDSFLDSLTHPLADMVNIRMEVLGDPAWISQSQFIPLNASSFAKGAGKASDPDIGYWRRNRDRIWNSTLRCYNTDVAEPIIMLNFRMPTDLNDQTGLYELQADQSAEFSGLYRVVQIEHNFVDGKYTNVLNLTRFNNQGVIISSPIPSASVTSKNGESFIVLKNELTKFYNLKELTNVKSNLTNIGRKYVDLVSSNVSRIKNKITNKIKGLLT